MILEIVLFNNPPDLDRQTELDGARAVVAFRSTDARTNAPKRRGTKCYFARVVGTQ